LNDSVFDLREHALDIGQHVVIPESQHGVTMLGEDRGPACISCRVGGVLSTIDLDDEFELVASKIGEVRPDANLPAEMCARPAKAMAQMPPKALLGLGWILPKSPGDIGHQFSRDPHP
jgi:hypothetical protein